MEPTNAMLQSTPKKRLPFFQVCAQLLMIVLLALVISLPASAIDTDFTIENGVLIEYTGPGGDVTMPDGVSSIGDMAFYRCTELTSVNIPEGVATIGNWAFFGCSKLTNVVIPESVTTIGGGAFMLCNSITNITIPKNVNFVNQDKYRGAFFQCSNLTSVTISDGVTAIDQAFDCCVNLKSITIPDSVTSISGAFNLNKSLDVITLPKNITSIGSYTFFGCKSLTDITIPDSVTSIHNHAFSECTGLTNIVIPSSVNSIYRWAFAKCINLIDVVIPSSVSFIDNSAFEKCPNMIIHGAKGSTAEAYALENGIPFIADQVILPPTIAYARPQSIQIDGKDISFQTYALKDANGNLTNYVKLRDIASVLNGTAAQFEVGYDGTINITTGLAYTPNGSEMYTPFSGDKEYKVNSSPVKINGVLAMLDGIVLTDQSGGYTYFKLRDLGRALDFNVSWDVRSGKIIINSEEQYSDAF